MEFEIAIAHIPSDFLQRDIHHEGHRHLIFASLQLSFLSKSKIWLIDGTFKVVREPFEQLVNIHSHIKSDDCVLGGLWSQLSPLGLVKRPITQNEVYCSNNPGWNSEGLACVKAAR